MTRLAGKLWCERIFGNVAITAEPDEPGVYVERADIPALIKYLRQNWCEICGRPDPGDRCLCRPPECLICGRDIIGTQVCDEFSICVAK